MSGGTGSPSGDGERAEQTASQGATATETGRAVERRVPGVRGLVASFGTASEYVGDALETHLGIDARALAAFRISLGAILVGNLLLRARHLTAFHADAGVYPRSVLAEVNPAAARLSLFAQFGSTEAQAVLFVIAGTVALALLVGYRSSLAALVSFVFLVSLNIRNPTIVHGGDLFLQHLLFWTILLPVGERWSVDALRRDRSPRARIASLATAGLLCQVVVVYVANAVAKSRGSTWGEGLGAQYVFHLDQITVLLGNYLADVVPLLVALDYVWYWMVTLSVLLILLRGWPRAVFAGLFVGAHASMLVTIHIGTFAFISIAGLLIFFPEPIWDRVERHLAEPLSARLAGLRAAIARRRRGRLLPRPSWSGRVVGGWRSIVVPLVAALAISSITVGSAAVMYADQGNRWTMFAPDPMQEASWFTMGGTTASGESVDAFPFREANLTADPPPDMAATYPTMRWGKYYQTLRPRHPRVKTSLADFACRRWNATHDDSLLNVTVTQHVERIVLDGPNPRRNERLVTYDCRTNSRVSTGVKELR